MHPRQKTHIDVTVNLIFDPMLTLQLVEAGGIHNFTTAVDPKFLVPSHRTVNTEAYWHFIGS